MHLLLFLKKNIIIRLFLGGKPPNPPGSASRKVWGPGHSAKQNYAFCFFFWKKKNTTRTKNNKALINSGSTSGKFGDQEICEAELRFLLLLLEKEEHRWTKKDNVLMKSRP
jgi:hypothetical protein